LRIVEFKNSAPVKRSIIHYNSLLFIMYNYPLNKLQNLEVWNYSKYHMALDQTQMHFQHCLVYEIVN